METATKDRPKVSIEVETSNSSKRWIATVIVSVLAVAVAAVFFITGASGPSTPVEIGNAYMEARNAFDAEGASSLMSADATITDAPSMERNELEQGFEALRVYDAQWEPFECTDKPGTTLVTCEYALETNLSRIVGHTPVEGSILLQVEEGQITSLVHNFNVDDYGPNVFHKWMVWLGTEHPGAIEELYVYKEDGRSPVTEPAALAQLATYIEEYDRSVNG